MTSRDFCYWLQGYLEINAADVNPTKGLGPTQVECVAKHLALVFKHEIDPSAGSAAHQAILDAIHNPPAAPGIRIPPPGEQWHATSDASGGGSGPVYRC